MAFQEIENIFNMLFLSCFSVQVSGVCADSTSGTSGTSGTLRAHGAVLRSASPVLNALLSAPMKEGSVARWHGRMCVGHVGHVFFWTTWMSGKCLVNATDPTMFHLYLPSDMGLFHMQHFLMSSTTSTPKPRCDTTSGSR